MCVLITYIDLNLNQIFREIGVYFPHKSSLFWIHVKKYDPGKNWILAFEEKFAFFSKNRDYILEYFFTCEVWIVFLEKIRQISLEHYRLVKLQS